jgi:hypothetical protein
LKTSREDFTNALFAKGFRPDGNGGWSKQANNRAADAPAVLEPNPCDGSLGAAQSKEEMAQRVLVRIESVRTRLLDTDNLCEKYLVDLCRYAGIIKNDNPENCQIETNQRKSFEGESEKTIIEVTFL